MMEWDEWDRDLCYGVPGEDEPSLISLCLPFLADPDRRRVTRLEAEATIPTAASPSQPLLIMTLQEEQDKCKGMLEV